MRATILPLVAILAGLGGCVSTETTTRNSGPSDDAGEQNYQLGAQYFRNGNYDLAQARLERAIELDSRNANAYSLLALTFVELGNHRLANENFSRAVRLAPNNKDVRNAYAVYLCQQRDFDEAMEQFDRAINVRENDTRWIEMTNAGVCVAQRPDLALAEQYFRQAIQLRPTFGEALIQMAVLKHRTEDNLTARAFLQRYLAANPASAPVLYLAVQIETVLGDDRAATDYMNRLLRDFPESAEARLMLQQGARES
jgi:type IV pilus assembly protein PilF